MVGVLFLLILSGIEMDLLSVECKMDDRGRGRGVRLGFLWSKGRRVSSVVIAARERKVLVTALEFLFRGLVSYGAPRGLVS